MDVDTERGQSALRLEREAVRKFTTVHQGYDFIETPKDKPALVDGVFAEGGVVRAVVEVKVRKLTRRRLRELGDTWLSAMTTLDAGRAASFILGAPFVGMLYLIPEKRLLTLKITNDKGHWALDFEKKETTTQKSINGGEAVRLTAYLPLATAKEHE